MTMPTAVYLDYQATTPVDPRVLDAMLPFFSARFGNPASTQHEWGRDAAYAVETARAQVAALIGAEPREIVFTSGATEANNLAIKGAGRFAREHGRGDRVVTFASEHKCVLESCNALAAEGLRLTVLPVGADGMIDLAALAAALDEKTILVSAMAVNNEIGIVQPLAEIGALCRARGILLHTDAAQATGKIALDVDAMNIDLLSVSGHKLYAPKGIGALYVRRRPRARLNAEMSGGGQERGLRSGTLAPALIVALGLACAISATEMDSEAARLVALRARLLDALRAGIADFFVNGSMTMRVPGNLNVGIPGIDAEALMASLGDVAISTGSACTSASVEPSYVLQAIGLDRDAARACVRIGLGRFTTEAEIDHAAARIVATVNEMRSRAASAAAE
jgi:cysteine desulfurase